MHSCCFSLSTTELTCKILLANYQSLLPLVTYETHFHSNFYWFRFLNTLSIFPLFCLPLNCSLNQRKMNTKLILKLLNLEKVTFWNSRQQGGGWIISFSSVLQCMTECYVKPLTSVYDWLTVNSPLQCHCWT